MSEKNIEEMNREKPRVIETGWGRGWSCMGEEPDDEPSGPLYHPADDTDLIENEKKNPVPSVTLKLKLETQGLNNDTQK